MNKFKNAVYENALINLVKYRNVKLDKLLK